jgi:ribonuclease J
MDSTNSGQRGFSGSESELLQTYREILAESKGRILISTFSSSLPRLVNVSRLAREQNRKVALIGRSFLRHFSAAVKTGYLIPDETFISIQEASELPAGKVLYFVTGSQGEVNAALTKIASGRHRDLTLSREDTIIFASRAIPGNERAIGLLKSSLEESGAKVITSSVRQVHVSGHAYREELAYLLNLTRPKTVMPVHGEFSMLNRHQSWLNRLARPGQKILLRTNGDEIILSAGECFSGGQVPVELIPIDGNQLVPISPRALKQRKDLMYSGLIVISGVRDFGKMSWDVVTAGIAEEKKGSMQRLVMDFLNLKCQNTTSGALKRTLKKAIRPHYKGMPVIKIILEGKIL